MSLREFVKQNLRMCGHAFVGTVHDRLDLLERQVNDLSLQVAGLAETQEALLRASIYLVEARQQQRTSDGGERLDPPDPGSASMSSGLHDALTRLEEEVRQLRGRLDSLCS